MSAPPPDPSALPAHVSRNLDTLADLHSLDEQQINRHQRAIETLTASLGRPLTLYVIVAVVLAWIGGNALLSELGVRTPDSPPFYWLQGLVTLCSLLTSTIVLITQNRLGRISDRRQRLDLQVNLQAEQRIAKLISLLEELRRDLPNVRNRRDSEADAMSSTADPRAVASALESVIEAAEADVASGGSKSPR
jgi:uncharacterized membrane protein